MHRVSDSAVMMLDIDPAVDWTFEAPACAARRIILNLCGNAFKFTTQGFVKVAAHQESPDPAAPKTRVIHIEITDTGSGIGYDFIRHNLFTPFSKESIDMPGAGIGLSLAKRFVEVLGGSINVESQIGEGTHIAVKLPMPVSDLGASIARDLDNFNAQVNALTRPRVSVAGFSTANTYCSSGRDSNMLNEQALMEGVCRKWLKMGVVDIERSKGLVVGLVLCDASAYIHIFDYRASGPGNLPEPSSSVLIDGSGYRPMLLKRDQVTHLLHKSRQ
jgi:hypothetical protein